MVEVIRINQKHIQSLKVQASDSSRLRQHYNLHKSFSDPCQRLLNTIEPGSYIRPHRHSLDPKHETLIAVVGLFGLITFNDHGAITSIEKFGTELYYRENYSISLGVELSPSVWHTVVALKPSSALLEVKAGPFDPDAAKELAPWAPEEGSKTVVDYMKWLKSYLH